MSPTEAVAYGLVDKVLDKRVRRGPAAGLRRAGPMPA